MRSLAGRAEEKRLVAPGCGSGHWTPQCGRDCLTEETDFVAPECDSDHSREGRGEVCQPY